jgi:photosystem II stability/assembly factor-like uncharacterized protein
MRNKSLAPTITFFSMLVLFISCSKPGNNNPPPNPPAPDTLSTGWTKVIVGPGNDIITDVVFVDALKGYCTGNDGNIYRSLDGGLSWSKIYSSNSHFSNMAAFGNYACFVNSTDTMYYTTDGGATIQKRKYIPNAGTGAIYFTDVAYTNLGTCFAGSWNHFYRSTNGGVLFDTLYHFVNSHQWRSVSFLNENEGWLTGASEIFHTINGGINWTSFPNPISDAILASFYTSSAGYLTSFTSVYKTLDAGTSWQPVFIPASATSSYIDIAVINAQVAYICHANRVYKTTNGGVQWNVVAALGQGIILEVHFVDANHGWACGENGTILRFSQ